MRDPVAGSLQVSTSYATGERCHVSGIISAPDIAPFSVEHDCTVPSGQWPQPGQSLPVTVDRSDPSRFEITWSGVVAAPAAPAPSVSPSAVPPASGPPVPPAGAHVDTSRSTTSYVIGPGGSGQLPPGITDEVRSLIDRITADARAAGATVTTDVNYEVVGAPGRPLPGTPGGGLTPDQAAAGAGGLQPAGARVLAVHDIAVPAGMPGVGAGGLVDLTLDVQWPGGGGWATTMRIGFSTPERRARIATVGTMLPVLVDPDAHDRIAIDTARLG